MEASDDAFLRFLASHSGRALAFLPAEGGLDDALDSLAFHELCARHGVGVTALTAPDASPNISPGPADADRPPVVVGSVAVAARERERLRGRRVAVLPGALSRFEELDDDFDPSVTVFWRDRESHRMAALRGLPSDRSVLCRPLAVHLDASTFAIDAGAAEGGVILVVGPQEDRPSDGGGPRGMADSGMTDSVMADSVRLHLDGRDGRWASAPRCRSAVAGAVALIADAAEVNTDSPGLAILAARLGRAVRLSLGRNRSDRALFEDAIAPLHPSVTSEPEAPDGAGDVSTRGVRGELGELAASAEPGREIGRVRSLLAAAKRETQHLTQERDRLSVAVIALRDESEVEASAIVRASREARGLAERQAADAERRAEVRVRDAEGRAAEAERRTADRLAAAELDAAQAREAATAAAARSSAVERAREADRAEAAAREAAFRDASAAREAELEARLAALEAALDTRTHQALALQLALDAQEARAFAAEGRIARMRAMIDARTASGDAARRDAEATGRRLDALVSSGSWRATRPFRKLSRGIMRFGGGSDGGSGDAGGGRRG